MTSAPTPKKRKRGPAAVVDGLPGPVYTFFGGKGGTGKTTCAAGAAIVAAERDRRVLVVSTDPAHSLGDALATRLGPRPARVRTRRGELWAAELDADRALARWLTERRAALRAIAERGTYLDDEDIERLLRLSLPGVDELVGLLELARLAGSGRYQDVVVDTAPTGHTLRLLATPATVRRIAGILDHMYAKHRFLAERLGGAAYRPDASDALIDEMDVQGRDLQAMLQDGRRASFVWVLLPETLSVEEAKDAIRELSGSGLAVRELIVNRLLPPPGAPCRFCRARARAERDAVRATRAAFPGRELRVVPDQPREPRGLSALRAIGRSLAGPAGRPDLPVLRPSRERAAPAAEPPRDGGRPAWLDLLAPRDARLVLFAGKGGVGKTTCAATAALALAARAPRRKVLLLSTDPAHSLGDVLATSLSDDERALPGAPGALRARELDAHHAFSRRRDRYRAAVDELFDAVRRGSAFDAAFDRTVVRDLIDLAPPGLDELFAILSVTEALFARDRAAAYDVVVVDTAPTGHALRLLALPGTALEWVRALLAILLKYRQVVGLGTLARDLVEMSRELRELEALLHDARATRVVAVTRAAEVPRLETARLLAALARRGLGVPAVIVNALTPPGNPACRRCARARAAETREVEAIRRRCLRLTGCRLIRTAAVAPPPRGLAALERWGRTWAAA